MGGNGSGGRMAEVGAIYRRWESEVTWCDGNGSVTVTGVCVIAPNLDIAMERVYAPLAYSHDPCDVVGLSIREVQSSEAK